MATGLTETLISDDMCVQIKSKVEQKRKRDKERND